MQTNVERDHIRCATCGRTFAWKTELAGQVMNCSCGTALRAPADRQPHADEDAGEYDFAELAPVAPRTKARPPAVGLAAAAAGLADAPHAAAPAAPLRVQLPPQRKALTPEIRVDDDDPAMPSTLRDWVAPSILIAVGVALRSVEVAVVPGGHGGGAGAAIAGVVIKLVLSVGLMLGGMVLAVQLMEVCFLGALSRTTFKLVAIAVAPGALYGILTELGGPMYGSMIGTFASVATYGLLFWLLMRLELKDAGICVLVTWILITAANYAAYKLEGVMRDAWV